MTGAFLVALVVTLAASHTCTQVGEVKVGVNSGQCRSGEVGVGGERFKFEVEGVNIGVEGVKIGVEGVKIGVEGVKIEVEGVKIGVEGLRLKWKG